MWVSVCMQWVCCLVDTSHIIHVASVYSYQHMGIVCVACIIFYNLTFFAHSFYHGSEPYLLVVDPVLNQMIAESDCFVHNEVS